MVSACRYLVYTDKRFRLKIERKDLAKCLLIPVLLNVLFYGLKAKSLHHWAAQRGKIQPGKFSAFH